MDYRHARYSMVENQIRTNRVTDPLIIAAMHDLPRETFVPADLQAIAYVDEDLPLGNGRFLMEPLVTAQLLQAAEIRAEDKVLEVGCGIGYATAIIARIAGAVFGLESDPGLAAHARSALEEQGCTGATVVEGALSEGYPDEAPYDLIIFGGAISVIPAALPTQLRDGGRIVAVLSDETGNGKATILVDTNGVLSRREFFDAHTPLLPGFEAEIEFQF